MICSMTMKLKKMADIKTYSNVIDDVISSYDPPVLNRTWNDGIFEKKQDIILELGCGAGDYTLNMARLDNDKNFIGIDIKGPRIWKGATAALDEQINNAVFVRINIDFIHLFFPENTVSEIWLPFPDPQMKKPNRNYSKRLTSAKFLEIYKKILSPGGIIHLKTDSRGLYEYTLKTVKSYNGAILRHTDDLYTSDYCDEQLAIQTHYEKRYLGRGKTIKYVMFSLG